MSKKDDNETSIPTYVLMKLEPQTEPVYFVVSHSIHDYHIKRGINVLNSPERNTVEKFYFEEHTCPINFIPVEAIINGKERDPHGLFKYCSEVLVSDVETNRVNGIDPPWEVYFPELRDDDYDESDYETVIKDV